MVALFLCLSLATPSCPVACGLLARKCSKSSTGSRFVLICEYGFALDAVGAKI